MTSGSQWFVITSHNQSCRAPSGRWILGGVATQGGASRLRRDALPWADLSLPLRGVRTIAPLGPSAEVATMLRRGKSDWRLRLNRAIRRFSLGTLFFGRPGVSRPAAVRTRAAPVPSTLASRNRSVAALSLCGPAVAYGSAVNEDGGKRTRFSGVAGRAAYAASLIRLPPSRTRRHVFDPGAFFRSPRRGKTG